MERKPPFAFDQIDTTQSLRQRLYLSLYKSDLLVTEGRLQAVSETLMCR